MSNWYVVIGAVGITCVLTALVGLGTALAAQRAWGQALACLGVFAMITLLTLVGIEYADSLGERRR